MSNLSTKFIVSGIVAATLLAVVPNTSFSEGESTVSHKANTLTLSIDSSMISGSADGSNKTTSALDVDDLTEQYSSMSCTTCRTRYYTQGTPYYMNYPAYQQCIAQPCS